MLSELPLLVSVARADFRRHVFQNEHLRQLVPDDKLLPPENVDILHTRAHPVPIRGTASAGTADKIMDIKQHRREHHANNNSGADTF